jgi:hypothetical protein
MGRRENVRLVGAVPSFGKRLGENSGKFGRVTELCRLSYEYPSFCAKQEPQTSILEC